MKIPSIQISEEFAKDFLRGLYKLDNPIGALDALLSKIPDEDKVAKESLKKVIGEIMYITLSELMVPIYRCHRSLGRASEPGSWLKESQES